MTISSPHNFNNKLSKDFKLRPPESMIDEEDRALRTLVSSVPTAEFTQLSEMLGLEGAVYRARRNPRRKARKRKGPGGVVRLRTPTQSSTPRIP